MVNACACLGVEVSVELLDLACHRCLLQPLPARERAGAVQGVGMRQGSGEGCQEDEELNGEGKEEVKGEKEDEEECTGEGAQEEDEEEGVDGEAACRLLYALLINRQLTIQRLGLACMAVRERGGGWGKLGPGDAPSRGQGRARGSYGARGGSRGRDRVGAGTGAGTKAGAGTGAQGAMGGQQPPPLGVLGAAAAALGDEGWEMVQEVVPESVAGRVVSELRAYLEAWRDQQRGAEVAGAQDRLDRALPGALAALAAAAARGMSVAAAAVGTRQSGEVSTAAVGAQDRLEQAPPGALTAVTAAAATGTGRVPETMAAAAAAPKGGVAVSSLKEVAPATGQAIVPVLAPAVAPAVVPTVPAGLLAAPGEAALELEALLPPAYARAGNGIGDGMGDAGGNDGGDDEIDVGWDGSLCKDVWEAGVGEAVRSVLESAVLLPGNAPRVPPHAPGSQHVQSETLQQRSGSSSPLATTAVGSARGDAAVAAWAVGATHRRLGCSNSPGRALGEVRFREQLITALVPGVQYVGLPAGALEGDIGASVGLSVIERQVQRRLINAGF